MPDRNEDKINMRQYELAIRIAQVHHLVDERKYKKALAVIQTIDMRQVRSLSDLKAFAEVYTKTEQYEAAKATYLRIYRRSRTRRVLYRLIYLSIRTNALEDAEAYYEEFVRMNPSARDALILRYRIDKASGAPIGQLIGILQELKQEEYIEEWAYELAKLYHRAGRREECMEECKDILLWFGTGEIVERAKILIDHLQEKDPIPYYDDKDFTIPREETPNPDDTGSLPDIKQFLKERKAEKKEERHVEKAVHKAAEDSREFKDDYEEDSITAREKREEAEPIDREDKWGDEEDTKTFIDDYEEDNFGQDGLILPQMAKDGIQKLSGLLKLGKKEEERTAEKVLNDLLAERPEKPVKTEKKQEEELEKKPVQKAEEKPDKKADKKTEKLPERKPERKVEKAPEKAVQKDVGHKLEKLPPHSQSGTGITQDLAKEISAIYEMEQQEQLKEKAVTILNEPPELPKSKPVQMAQPVKREQNRPVSPVRRPSGRGTGKTEHPANIATSVVDRMTQAIQKSASRNYIPLDIEEIQKKQEETEEQKDPLMKALDQEVEQYYEEKAKQQSHVEEETVILEEQQKSETEILKDLLEEEIQDPDPGELGRMLENGKTAWSDNAEDADSGQEKTEELVLEEEPDNQISEGELGEEPKEQILEQELGEELKGQIPEQELEEEPEVQKLEEGVGERSEEQILEEELREESEEQILEKGLGEEVLDEQILEEESGLTSEEQTPENVLREQEEEIQVRISDEELPKGNAIADEEAEKAPAEEETESAQSPLREYHAPEIPVVQTDYMEMPEITYEDLPTTRALQQSFRNVLRLIEGELDPSHFVLMGDGAERIVGVSKQIVRIMKETGYLSQGRIAKINAEQLNKMDLITFRGQLKGNCLLIENASDLLFPTITKIFSIMEEYYGDFVVILADEGTTLDQLFRFVPALARKFKYIIDISKYTEEDYQ
ncbi:MAG: hypothetical protein HFH73_12760 [Lachnospiraceae bacterium]|nr:hypothetical protein [Lachnospiraceae bacterium]